MGVGAVEQSIHRPSGGTGRPEWTVRKIQRKNGPGKTPGPFFRFLFRKGAALGDAGVAEQAIDPAEEPEDGVDGRLAVRTAGHIAVPLASAVTAASLPTNFLLATSFVLHPRGFVEAGGE